MHPCTRRPDRGSASMEYALLFTFLAVLAALAATAIIHVVNFELPDMPSTVQSPSEE